MDTNFIYAVIFNDEKLELSPKNEFTINSNRRIGKLEIYCLNNNDTDLVLEKTLRFHSPNFTVTCYNKYSGDTISKNDLKKAYIKVGLLNYDLNVHFVPKSVKLKFIGYSGENRYFEFEGYEIPQHVQEFLQGITRGILVFDIVIEIGSRKEILKSNIYYFDKND